MRPLTWNCLASAAILATGDLLSQAIEKKHSQKVLNRRRLVAMSLFGGLVRAPLLYVWFTKTLVKRFPGQGVKVVLQKTITHQFLFQPIFLASFFVIVTLLNGGDRNVVQTKLKSEYVPALLKAWVLWPAFHIFNFWLVPPKQQLMAANGVVVCWMAYLSYIEFRSSGVEGTKSATR